MHWFIAALKHLLQLSFLYLEVGDPLLSFPCILNKWTFTTRSPIFSTSVVAFLISGAGAYASSWEIVTGFGSGSDRGLWLVASTWSSFFGYAAQMSLRERSTFAQARTLSGVLVVVDDEDARTRARNQPHRGFSGSRFNKNS